MLLSILVGSRYFRFGAVIVVENLLVDSLGNHLTDSLGNRLTGIS